MIRVVTYMVCFFLTLCIWVTFISVINLSYKCRDLYLTLSTYEGASKYFILHASEEISGVGKASGASATLPECRREDSRILFSDVCI